MPCASLVYSVLLLWSAVYSTAMDGLALSCRIRGFIPRCPPISAFFRSVMFYSDVLCHARLPFRHHSTGFYRLNSLLTGPIDICKRIFIDMPYTRHLYRSYVGITYLYLNIHTVSHKISIVSDYNWLGASCLNKITQCLTYWYCVQTRRSSLFYCLQRIVCASWTSVPALSLTTYMYRTYIEHGKV